MRKAEPLNKQESKKNGSCAQYFERKLEKTIKRLGQEKDHQLNLLIWDPKLTISPLCREMPLLTEPYSTEWARVHGSSKIPLMRDIANQFINSQQRANSDFSTFLSGEFCATINESERMFTTVEKTLPLIKSHREEIVRTTSEMFEKIITHLTSPPNHEQLIRDESFMHKTSWSAKSLGGRILLALEKSVEIEPSFPKYASRGEVDQWLRNKLRNHQKIEEQELRRASPIDDKEFHHKNIDLVIEFLEDQPSSCWFWLMLEGEPEFLKLCDIAHLSIREPNEMLGMLVPTDSHVREVTSGLYGAVIPESGVDAYEYEENLTFETDKERQRRIDLKIPKKLVIKGTDGTTIQSESQDGDEPHLLLNMISDALGSSSVRDLLAIFLMNLQAGVRSNQAIYWHPKEHLAILGKDCSSHREKKRLEQRLEALSKVTLSVKTEKKKKGVELPIINFIDEVKDYQRIMLHPSLYNGIKSESKHASRSWPISSSVLHANVKEDKFLFSAVFYITCMFGSAMGSGIRNEVKTGRVWRVWEFEKSVNKQRFARAVGIRTEQRQDRKEEQLNKTLESLKKHDVIREYGFYEKDGESYITLKPGIFSCKAMKNIKNKGFFPVIPQTTEQLSNHITMNKWTRKKAAKELGISEKTLRDALKEPDESPIPVRLKKKLREYVWPTFEITEH